MGRRGMGRAYEKVDGFAVEGSAAALGDGGLSARPIEAVKNQSPPSSSYLAAEKPTEEPRH